MCEESLQQSYQWIISCFSNPPTSIGLVEANPSLYCLILSTMMYKFDGQVWQLIKFTTSPLKKKEREVTKAVLIWLGE